MYIQCLQENLNDANSIVLKLNSREPKKFQNTHQRGNDEENA